MQTSTVFLFGVLFCVVAVASAGGGGGKKGKGKWNMMKKCHDEEINTEEAFKGFKECKAEAEKEENTEEERRRRRSPFWGGGGGGKGGKGGKNICTAVCAWKKQGILDDSGNFNEEGAKEHVDKVYPEKYRAEALEKIKKCNEEHSSKFSMDDNCKGYMEFKKCTMGAHMKTCGIEWPMGGKGEGKGKGKWNMMNKCHDGEINTEEAFKGFKECKEEDKKKQENTDDEEERRRRRSPKWGGGGGKGGKWGKNMCTAVCAWKKQGIMDDSGKFNEDGAKEHVDKVYPEKYRADALEKIKKCNEDHSASFSMDDNCKGYMEFKKCSMGAHMKTCGIEWPMGGKGKGKPDAPPPSADEEGGEEE